MTTTFTDQSKEQASLENLDSPKPVATDENPAREDGNSYGQILKSSSIIGGAQVINMVIGLVRTKLVAVLIGPTGIGLLAIYQSITGLASIIAGLGINTSGVREVAKYHSKGDQKNIAKTIRTLRRICWFTGIAGMLMLAAFSSWISRVSFGTTDHAWAISVLGVTVLLGNVTAGQGAIIQGTRRIKDIARISIWSAVLGTIISVGFYWALVVEGVVPALVALSIVSLCISTYFASQIKLQNVIPTLSETWNQARSLVQFGIALVISGIMTTGVAYLIRLMIIQNFDLMAVGIYSAAFSLSGLFVQFVLSAMGADFYPRLVAVADDHNQMSRLINEQIEVGILLAFPGLLATLVFAPLAVSVFYSQEFSGAGSLLQWFVVGCMGRVLSWPLGYSILAKGRSPLYVFTETLFNFFHVVLVWIGIATIGLLGVSIAFAVLYFVYTGFMYLINWRMIGFTWSKSVLNCVFWMAPSVAFFYLITTYTRPMFALAIGGVATLVIGVFCLRQLLIQVGEDHKLSRTLRALPGGNLFFLSISRN